MPQLDLDNPAWRFAVALYGKPGVAPECLRLQDEAGLDVSLALVCLWLGSDLGIALDSDALAAAERAARDWCALSVRPLREVRRGLKGSPLIAEAAVTALRERVKALELEAERIEIALLRAWAEARWAGLARSGNTTAALANLGLILAGRGRSLADAPGLAAALAGMNATNKGNSS